MTATPERVCTTAACPTRDSASFCSGLRHVLSAGTTTSAEAPRSELLTMRPSRCCDRRAASPMRRRRPRPRSRAPRSRSGPPVVSTDSHGGGGRSRRAGHVPDARQQQLDHRRRLRDRRRRSALRGSPWRTATPTCCPTRAAPCTSRSAYAPGALAVAQRYQATLRVRSTVDRHQVRGRRDHRRRTAVGSPGHPGGTPDPRPSPGHRPGAVRVSDRQPSRQPPAPYTMSASDAEGVVVLDFVPPAVEVPAGETSDVTARLAAPEPPPGKEAHPPARPSPPPTSRARWPCR